MPQGIIELNINKVLRYNSTKAKRNPSRGRPRGRIMKDKEVDDIDFDMGGLQCKKKDIS